MRFRFTLLSEISHWVSCTSPPPPSSQLVTVQQPSIRKSLPKSLSCHRIAQVLSHEERIAQGKKIIGVEDSFFSRYLFSFIIHFGPLRHTGQRFQYIVHSVEQPYALDHFHQSAQPQTLKSSVYDTPSSLFSPDLGSHYFRSLQICLL